MRMTRRLTAKFRDDRMENTGRTAMHTPAQSLPSWMDDRCEGVGAYRYYFNVFIDRFCNRGTVSRVDLSRKVRGGKIDGGIIFEEGIRILRVIFIYRIKMDERCKFNS